MLLTVVSEWCWRELFKFSLVMYSSGYDIELAIKMSRVWLRPSRYRIATPALVWHYIFTVLQVCLYKMSWCRYNGRYGLTSAVKFWSPWTLGKLFILITHVNIKQYNLVRLLAKRQWWLMTCSWEDKHRSDMALAMHHRVTGISHLQVEAFPMEISTPAMLL